MINISGIRNKGGVNVHSLINPLTKEDENLGGNYVFPGAVRKAQAAVEYMMIIGIVLVILTPIVSYSYQYNETSVRTGQAMLAVSKLTSAADSLYAQGPGAKTTMDIFLPPGYLEQSFVSENTMDIKISTPSGINDIVKITKANLTGSLPKEPGYKRIILVTLESGQVNITE